MNTEEIKKYLEDNRLQLERWGCLIKCKIIGRLKADYGYDDSIVPCFIKIDPVPRIKTLNSILGKINKKGYEDPIRQVTDLIGVRFIVLLSEDIQKIADIINSETVWIASIAKDYIDDIDKNPKIFDYQSQHFDIRPRNEIHLDDVTIKPEISCEVQIRTLLQHAYAELVHDNIYKADSPVPTKAERQVAKSMALMETTDELFCSAIYLLREANEPKIFLFEFLSKLYAKTIKNCTNIHDKTNFIIIEQYLDFLKEKNLYRKIESLVEEKKFIVDKILQRQNNNFLFAQPIIFFLYWIVYTSEDVNIIIKNWPFPGNIRDIELVLSDLDKNEFSLFA